MDGNPVDDCNPVPKKETKSFEQRSESGTIEDAAK